MPVLTQLTWSAPVSVFYSKNGGPLKIIRQNGIKINSFVLTAVNQAFYDKFMNAEQLYIDIFVNFKTDGGSNQTEYKIVQCYVINEVERFIETLYKPPPCCDLCSNASKFWSVVVLLAPKFYLDPKPPFYQSILEDYYNNLHLAQSIFAMYCPFGNEELHNSITSGIVSNLFGTNKDVFITDCRLTTAFEGCPVFSKSTKPVGMMISNVLTPCIDNHVLTGLSFGISLTTLFSTIKRTILGSNSNSLKTSVPFNHYEKNQSDILVTIEMDNFIGSGILIHKEGLILTCAHVVNYEQGIKVRIIYNCNNFPGIVIFSASRVNALDMAVIKIIGNTSFPSCEFSLDPLIQGEVVFSLGHMKWGDTATMYVSKGSVSMNFKSFFVTTCICRPGTSGGALIRKNGEVLGLITEIFIDNNIDYPTYNVCTTIKYLYPFINNFISSKDTKSLMDAVKIYDELHPHGYLDSKL